MAQAPKVQPKKAPAKAGAKAVATKADAKAKKVTAKPEAKAKPAAEVVLLPVDTFAKFTGYVSETPEEDQDFEKGQIVYIVGVDEAEGDNPTMYSVIPGASVAAYIANPEDPTLEASQLVVQEVAALSTSAVSSAREQFMPIPSIGRLDELIEESEGDLIAAAQELFGEIEESFFYLGGVLAKARREGVYLVENGGKYEGENAWNEFCDGEFGFSGAKGGDLARLYTTFAAIEGFDPETMRGVGWSKVREIQRYVTDENYTELLDDARESSRTELKIKLVEKFASEDNKTPTGKAATRGGGSATTKLLALSFRLPEESHQAVQLALKEAIKVYGVNTDAEALERIIITWAEEHVTSASKKKSINTGVAKAHKAAPKAKAAA